MNEYEYHQGLAGEAEEEARRQEDEERDRERLTAEAVERTWRDHWAPLLCDDAGAVDLEKVKRELYDYAQVLDQVPTVYTHITGGRISKPNTLAVIVTTEADDLAAREREEREQKNDEAQRLHRAIRRITVDVDGETPNGPTEEALDELGSALSGEFASLEYAQQSYSKLLLAMADDDQELREAAEGFFGGDFKKPAEVSGG